MRRTENADSSAGMPSDGATRHQYDRGSFRDASPTGVPDGGQTVESFPAISKIAPSVDVVKFDAPPQGADETRKTRHTLEDVTAREGAVQLAYQLQETISWGWWSPSANGDVAVNISGSALTGRLPTPNSSIAETIEVKGTHYPPNGEGTLVSPEAKNERYGEFSHWGRVELTYQGPPPGDTSSRFEVGGKSGIFPGLTMDNVVLGPYKGDGYVVETVLVPLHPDQLKHQKDKAAREYSTAMKKQSEADNVRWAKKAGNLHAELDRDEVDGRFHASIVLGARTAKDLKQLQALVAGASRTELAYKSEINPLPFGTYPEAVAGHPNLADSPGVSAEVATRFMPKPSREHRNLQLHGREDYDIVVEGADKIPEGYSAEIGRIVDRYGVDQGPLLYDKRSSVKHMIVNGATGVGKSMLVSTIAAAHAVGPDAQPVLLVNPKAERPDQPGYAERLAELLEGTGVPVTKYEIGKLDAVTVFGNPLDPGAAKLPEYIDPFITILADSYGSESGNDDPVASEMTQRFLTLALKGRDNLYKKFGWNVETGEPLVPGSKPLWPNMWDLIDHVEEVGLKQDYILEASNVVKFLKQRTESKTRGMSGLAFGGEEMDWDRMFTEPGIHVIDISRIPERDQTLLGGVVLLRVNGHLRNKGGRITTIYEEANKFLREGPLADTVGDEAAESREIGGSLIFVNQNPHLISERIRGNVGKTVNMRLNTKQDKEAGQSNTNMTDGQAAELPTYMPGEFAYFAEGMSGPVRAFSQDLSHQTGEATVERPETMIKPGTSERPLTAIERSNLLIKLNDSAGGKRLSGIVEITLFAVEAHVGEYAIRIDNSPAAAAFNVPVAEIRSWPRKEREFLVKEAVTRAVRARSGFMINPQRYIDTVTSIIHTALADTDPENPFPVPNLPGPDLRVKALQDLRVKAALYEHIAIEKAKGLKQQDVPPLGKFEGRVVPGGSASAQLNAISEAQTQLGVSSQPFIFAKDPYNEQFFIDAPAGHAVKTAIDQGKEDGGLERGENGEAINDSWIKRFSPLLWGLKIPNRLLSLYYNELTVHIKEQAKEQKAKKETGKPAQAALPSNNAEQVTLVTAQILERLMDRLDRTDKQAPGDTQHNDQGTTN